MPKHKNVLKEFEKENRRRELRKQNKNKPAKQKSQKSRNKNWRQNSTWDEFDLGNDGFEKFRSPKPKSNNPAPLSKQANSKAQIDADLEEGKIIEVTGNLVNILIEKKQVRCHLRGSLKHELEGFVNAVVVGDNVQVKIQGDQGVVETVLPRTSYLSRPYMPDKGKAIEKQQLIAANVDQLLIVASWHQPNIWPELIDKYLIVAQRNDLKALICVNKIDLSDSIDEIKTFMQPYSDLDYKVILTSASDELGIKNLREKLTGKTTVLAGLSGVGKSSLINAIVPGLNIHAKTVGQRGINRNQGRHTTTTSNWYSLPFDGSVIDTPGIREFALMGLYKSDLAEYYPEVEKHILNCKFSNCSHEIEEDCAVLKAHSRGLIPELRMKTYLSLLSCLPD